MLVLEVGETADNRLTTNVAAVWDDYADKALIDARLQVFYTKRRLIDLALGFYRNQVDFQAAGDIGMKLDQRTKHLADMRAQTEAEIEAIQVKSAKRRGGASTPLTTVAPVTAPVAIPYPFLLDANDPAFTGSPYFQTDLDAGSMHP